MCGGKGKQSVNQTQQYTPDPRAYGALSGALNQVQNVSQTPFQTPQAPVAGFSNDQQRAFDITNQAQGAAQPFFNQAASYFSPEGAAQFFNPMASGVMAGMKDIFGQQMKETTGNLTQQAGGVGADRIAVGQAQLGRQQDLAAGQTLSDLYARAQQQAQGAAFGMGSLGPAMQNSILQGAQSLLGTGGLQQQLSQAQLNAPYQNILQRIQWPYQNAQFNATNTAALAPGMGGTTAGQTTYPAPSPWGTILGAGAAGLGAAGSAGMFNGMFGGGGGGYNQYNPEPFGVNSDTDASLIGNRGGRVPNYADGGDVDAGNDPIQANAMEGAGYADGGAPDDNPDDLGGMVSTHPLEGAGGDLIPHQQIQPIKANIPQLPQVSQGGGGGGGSGGSDWAKAAGTAAQVAMMFLNRGGSVPHFALGGETAGNPSQLAPQQAPQSASSPMPLPPQQGGGMGGFGSGGGKGGLMSMLGGGGPGGFAQHMPQMGGLVQGMMNSPPPPMGGVVQGMMNTRLPPMSSIMGRMFGNRGMPGGGFGGGMHAFDPRSYMTGGMFGHGMFGRGMPGQPQMSGQQMGGQQTEMARGGPAGYADGGPPDGSDEMIPPPYDPREASRAVMPNITSLLSEREPPPPQIEGHAPGKVRSFEDPRLMGAVPEAAMFAMPGVAASAPEIGMLARPGMTAAREALERAPGIVNKALAGSPAGRMGNPVPYLAAGMAGGSRMASGAELTGGPTDEEKAEIGTLQSTIGKYDTEIARLRRINKDDEQFNQKSAKVRGDRERAQQRLDLVNGNVETRRKRLEDIEFGQHVKQGEAEQPFRVQHPDAAKNLPMYSMGAAGGLGLLSGMLNKGKMLKPVGIGLASGAGEGALTSMGPSLYDMGNLPLGSKHQKEASDQIWGPVDRGDYSFYKNRVAGDSLLNAGIAGTAAAVGSYGPKVAGKLGEYAGAMMRPLSRMMSGAPSAEATAAQRVKMRLDAEHKIGPAGSEVVYKKYVHPTTGRTMWHENGKVISGKNLPPEVPREARGGRISGFAPGGATSFDDAWGDVNNAVDNGQFDPGSEGSYFSDEAKAARNFIPTPRSRPEVPDDGGDASPVAFKQPSMRGVPSTLPQPPAPGGNPYGSPSPQGGGGNSFLNSPWAALMQGGLGMMAAQGQRDSRGLPMLPGAAIATGALGGFNALKQQQEAGVKQQSVDQGWRRLQQQADMHADNYNKLTMAQKVQLMRPHEIGVGRYGEKMMGLPKLGPNGEITNEYTPIDPATGLPMQGQTVRPGSAGAPVQTPKERLIQAGQERYEQENIPVMAQLAQYERDNPRPGVNPDALSDMKPEDARIVKAIADGRQRFIPNRRNDARGQYLMSKVHEYDPNVDETTFQRRQRTTNFFAVGTQGGGGQNIAAMNTWAQHVDEYLNLSKELDLGRFKSWNEAYNWMTEHGYTKERAQVTLGKLQGAAKAVADEGAKVFAGSTSALKDREAWHDYFDPSTPRKVAIGKAQEIEKLVEGRLKSVANQYNEGMRTSHDPLNFIAPQTREVLNRLKSEDPYAPTAGKPAAPQQPQQPQQPAGQEGEMKQFKQGWGIFHNGKWQPYTNQGPTQ